MANAVVKWFGDDFSRLHPLLQKLHIEGGELSGTVDVHYGQGLAGFIGQRIGPRLGLPAISGSALLKVKISHTDDCLVWNRVFNNNSAMNSTFTPHGSYKQGYWTEGTGKLSLDLGVDIIDGGWYWRQRKMKLYGLRLPLCLFPKSYAYKKIVDDRYFFSVSFSLPILGELVSYGGNLQVKKSSSL